MPKELNVTDVTFEDVGDWPVPSEYQSLYDEYIRELEWLTRPGTAITTLFWCALECHYTNRMLEKSRHKSYTKSLLCSGDPGKIEAAVEAMKRTMLKWDSSRGVAKMNQQAYGKREEKKLRDKSAPKIQAWEQEVHRNPYHKDDAAVEAYGKREEKKLLERVEAYQEKWHSHGYPIQVQEISNENEEQVNTLKVVTCSTKFDKMWMEEHEPSDKGRFDSQGRYWCEKCQFQYDFMQIGAAKGYPMVKKGKDHIVVHSGEQKWLACARDMGHWYVEEAIKLAK